MKTITGLNYYYKLDQMIQECINNAKLHPFEQDLFIAEDKNMVEKMFFKHTHYLVNIQVITWTQFLKSLQVKHHLTHHRVANNVELTYHLLKIFKEETLTCFQTNQPYPLIKKIIPLMKELNINNTVYEVNNDKLHDYMTIYHSLKKALGEYTHLSLEEIINLSSLKEECMHIYIEADSLHEDLRKQIIDKLSQHHEVTMMYTCTSDNRLFNIPFSIEESIVLDQPNHLLNHLFSTKVEKLEEEHEIYTFAASTPLNEVKRVVYSILEKITDEKRHYEDYMIVYPDENYKDILLRVLENRNVPHNLKITKSCLYDYDYQFILKKIDEIEGKTMSDFVVELLNEDLDVSYKEYLQSLSYDMNISNEEFKQFFIETYDVNHHEVNSSKDCLHIVPIEKVKSHNKKHIYILGLNETILPALIKDTSLLLDEDIMLLRSHHISTPYTTLEKTGMNQNHILKALQCPYHTLTLSYCVTDLDSKPKLPSSLYKQLEQMYDLKPAFINKYKSCDDFYLSGGRLNHKLINHSIDSFKDTRGYLYPLDKELVEALYDSTLSVSKIETYNKCPYLYFIQYGLGIYPLNTDEIKSNELGSLVHYVLSLCLNKDKNINSLVDGYLSKNEDLNNKIQSSYINKYFIEQLKKDLEITLTVLRHFKSQSLFINAALEERVIDDIKGLNFKGFVDRVDTFENYISIIDYKSSAKDIDLNLAMQGFNIQMLLYLDMMTRKYDKDPGAVLYFNTKRRVLASKESVFDTFKQEEFESMYKFLGYVIDDNGDVIEALDPHFTKKSNIIPVTYVKKDDTYKGNILTQEQLDVLLYIIKEHVYDLYLKMTSGHIEILPKGSDDNSTHTKVNPCRYCDYKNVCHFDIFYHEYQNVEFYDVKEKLGGEENGI